MKKPSVVAILVLAGAILGYAQTTVLFRLAKNGTPQQILNAIKNGAEVNARDENGQTALMYAARYNPNSAVLAILLEAGADVNAKEDRLGWTALVAGAAFNPNPEVTTELLKGGATVNISNELGYTPLMMAARSNKNPEVVARLLRAGANKNAVDVSGASPLMWAVRFNENPLVITKLLSAGVDAKARDEMGQTAFEYAQGNKALKGTDALRRLQNASR